MRTANILAGIAALGWFAMLWLGRDLVGGVVAQKVIGGPNVEQIDYGIVWPALVLVALLASAWTSNALRRWFGPLAVLSGVALVALLPYLAFAGGGV